MIYVAGPYYHIDPAVIEKRMEVVYSVMASLFNYGLHPVSPMLMHSVVIRHSLPNTFEFWGSYSFEMLSKCHSMVVIKSEGWETSRGVKAEIEFCKVNKIFIMYVDPKDYIK